MLNPVSCAFPTAPCYGQSICLPLVAYQIASFFFPLWGLASKPCCLHLNTFSLLEPEPYLQPKLLKLDSGLGKIREDHSWF